MGQTSNTSLARKKETSPKWTMMRLNLLPHKNGLQSRAAILFFRTRILFVFRRFTASIIVGLSTIDFLLLLQVQNLLQINYTIHRKYLHRQTLLLERKRGDEWGSACRNVKVVEERCVGRGRMTWRESTKADMKLLGLQPYWMGDCSKICGEASYWGKRLTLAEQGRNWRF